MMSRISRYHVDWVGEYVSLICGCDQYKYLIGKVSFGRQRFHMVVADLRDVSAVVTIGCTYGEILRTTILWISYILGLSFY